MTEGVLLLVVVLGIGWYGWTHITDDIPRVRFEVRCKWTLAHPHPKTLVAGTPNAPVTDTMCEDCLALWLEEVERTPRKFAA